MQKSNLYGFKRNTNGFTLLEIIVALFVFSIVSIILVTALHNAMNTQSSVAKKAERIAELQIALLMLSRDFEQTIARPIMNTQGQQEDFLGFAKSVTFTHAGLANPQGKLQRSTLQRTSYQLKKNNLIRYTWAVLDQADKSEASARILLQHVDALTFDYLDAKGTFQKTWPSPDNSKSNYPRAVRVKLTLKDWGIIHQLYIVPGQQLDKPK